MFELSRRCKQLHVKMITGLARDKHKRVLLIGLISMIVICGQVVSLMAAEYNDGDEDDEQRHRDREERGTAADNERSVGQPPRQDLLLALAVREFCSRHPAECDESADQLDMSGPLFDPGRGLYERQYNRKRRHEPTGGVRTTNQINRVSPVGEPTRPVRNSTLSGGANRLGGDDLDREGAWTGSPGRGRVRYAASSPPPTGWHRISTRSWRQLGLRTGPNTYRVSLEEARRFIRAQQQGQASYEMGTMAPALLYARPRVVTSGDPAPEQQQVATARVYDQHQQQPLDSFIIRPAAQAMGSGEPSTRSRAPVAIREQRSSVQQQQTPLSVPKRTELSPESPFALEGATTTKTTSSSTTSTSGHQLIQELGGSGAPDDKTREVMQCNLRRYTYRATKTDGRGNTCAGLVTASICYGGCDSGEIADWLFPYKKSIHKVCRHGGRVRRRVLLSECHSANTGGNQESIDDSLREYHYVDARDCICKKCSGADTNCLGTMTQPHLQTLGETVAELTGGD